MLQGCKHATSSLKPKKLSNGPTVNLVGVALFFFHFLPNLLPVWPSTSLTLRIT